MMKRLLMAPALPLALALLPLLATAGQAPGAETPAVTLAFEVGERKGAVLVGLFDSEAGYTGNQPVQSARVVVGEGAVQASFPGLKPGRYAAKAFHDVDGDGAMNLNAFDMPTEPFAFSNNAPARFGPAPWSAAAFEVGPDGAAQTLTLR